MRSSFVSVFYLSQRNGVASKVTARLCILSLKHIQSL
jgi:hypothetical protein